jgi:hypothetical protein
VLTAPLSGVRRDVVYRSAGRPGDAWISVVLRGDKGKPAPDLHRLSFVRSWGMRRIEPRTSSFIRETQGFSIVPGQTANTTSDLWKRVRLQPCSSVGF